MTKLEIIKGAYERMRISGITSIPSGGDIDLALRRLENMAEMWRSQNIDPGYNFEDSPDPGSLIGVPRYAWSAYESNLAMALLSDFNKAPHDGLIREAAATFSVLSSVTAKVNMTTYPSRMPIGRGNDRFGRSWIKHYGKQEIVPISTNTVTLYVGDVADLVEHFDSYLKNFELIASYTIEVLDPQNITVSNIVLSSPDITYRVTAGDVQGLYTVKIVATTTSGRRETRLVYVNVKEAV